MVINPDFEAGISVLIPKSCIIFISGPGYRFP